MATAPEPTFGMSNVAHGIDSTRVRAFAARLMGSSPEDLRTYTHALRGGLESVAIARWVVENTRDKQAHQRLTFVVKRLDGPQQREALVYKEVLTNMSEIAPALVGVERPQQHVTYLYLEYVRPARAWPWTDASAAGRVLDTLADLHGHLPNERLSGSGLVWDCETELVRSAEATIDAFDRTLAGGIELAWLGWARGALRRTVQSLLAMRRTLLTADAFGSSVIHGDVHSGNVPMTTWWLFDIHIRQQAQAAARPEAR